MSTLANALEALALTELNIDKSWSDSLLDDYQDLLDLANDLYVASLETHIASLNQAGMY